MLKRRKKVLQEDLSRLATSPKSPDAMDELIHMLDEGARVTEIPRDPFVTPGLPAFDPGWMTRL